MRVLAAGFPATERIVGAEFFAAMARAYVIAEPPRNPVLLRFGRSFPDFIARFEAAAALSYLADVARLEWLRRKAYHAADAAPLTAGELTRLDPAAFGSLVFRLHPACALLRSRHPAATIWAMNSDLEPLREPDGWPAEDVVVYRKGTGLDQAVLVGRLSPGIAAFLTALGAGCSISRAAEAAFREMTVFDLAAALALLFTNGLVTAVAASGKPSP